MRGQYMSALEHAVPERFFSDPAKCNLVGSIAPVAGLPDCAQGISAVKAIGLATAQGQKIYTITPKVYQDNPNIALSAHSMTTRNRVKNFLQSGMGVTIYQAPIVESRRKGAGFISKDSHTGAGAYPIEGGTNGGWYSLLVKAGGALLAILGISSLLSMEELILPITFAPWLTLAIAAVTLLSIYLAEDKWDPKDCNGISYCDSLGIIQMLVAGGALGALLGGRIFNGAISEALSILSIHER